VADHGECVDTWLERTAAGLSPEQEVALLERALAALWSRARRTLGELTLATIVDRVLTSAAVAHPIVAGMRMEANRVSCDELRRRAATLPDGATRAAIRDLLVEWLTVVGNLTAEIMTPALHDALRDVPPLAPDVEETP
jgi:hypothetical protein